MNIFLVTQQMLILFSMMGIGYFLYRLNWITESVSSALSKLVVNIFNPFLTIHSVFGQSLSSTGSIFWENLILVGLYYAILFLAGFLIVAVIRPGSSESPIYRLLALLPNCGFMGIPVVASLLGSDYIIYVAVYMLIYNVLMYTYGIYLVKKSVSATAQNETKSVFQTLRPLFLNSGVIASIIALLIFFLNLPVAAGLQDLCGYLGNPCIPLSMILIGCSIASSNLLSMLKNIRVYGFLLIRMLLVHAACTLLLPLLPFDTMILKLFILMLAMPAGSLVVLITQEHGGKTDCASCGVILSTLVSIVTIPLITLLL